MSHTDFASDSRVATLDEVREWALSQADDAELVMAAAREGRGAPSQYMIGRFNLAHATAKSRVYVSQPRQTERDADAPIAIDNGAGKSAEVTRADLREWAEANGFTVGTKGRISATVQKAYLAANG